MDWIIGSGLRFGRLVVALAIGLTVIGIAQLRSAPVDVYPEFMPPSVEIQTEALGLSAAEVEQLITLGLEQDLLNGVPWLDRIHSSSMPGLSVIDLTFQPRHRPVRRAAAGPGAADPGARAAQRGQPADHDPADGRGGPDRHDQAVILVGVPDRHVGARAVEDQAAADGRARRRERGHLRPAGPAAPGPGGPEEAAGRARDAHPAHRDRGQRAVGLAADVRGGVDAGYRRLLRVGQPAPLRPAHLPDIDAAAAGRRAGPGRRQAAAGRRGERDRGPPAADRRRGPERACPACSWSSRSSPARTR